MAVLIGSIGVGASIALYVVLRADESAAESERLAGAGDEVVRVVNDIEAVATEQVLAIRGLFESSEEVTDAEFERFVEVIGQPSKNRLAFAEHVPGAELGQFESLVRAARPNYLVHDSSGPIARNQPERSYWPLTYSSAGGAGFAYGFDLGSVPAIAIAIESALALQTPVATGFVTLPGDEEAGDIVIVASVHSEQVPIGVAIVTVQLDEILGERVAHLLGSDSAVKLRMSNGGSVPAHLAESRGAWRATVDLGGQPLVLGLEDTGAESESSRHATVSLVAIIVSLAAGWFAYGASRRRAVSVELGRLQESLREKDRFLASVSHELRTPLTAVVGILDILSSDEVDLGQDERNSLVADARESAADLERLVEDHLTAARLSAGALTVVSETVDLDDLMRSVVSSLNLPSPLLVTVEELGACLGDRLRIRQIARNILRNGARYAVASIEVRRVDIAPDRVRIEITNDGEPVSPSIAERLFEPFVGLGQPGQPESIGLGLAISRDLARRMGGDLDYDYIEGRACFGLTLPTVAVDAEIQPATAEGLTR